MLIVKTVGGSLYIRNSYRPDLSPVKANFPALLVNSCRGFQVGSDKEIISPVNRDIGSSLALRNVPRKKTVASVPILIQQFSLLKSVS
jgi:hypothetical protein